MLLFRVVNVRCSLCRNFWASVVGVVVVVVVGRTLHEMEFFLGVGIRLIIRRRFEDQDGSSRLFWV